MHNNLALVEQHRNGSLKQLQVAEAEKKDEMDTDQILNKLIELQVGGATRDEVLKQLRDTVARIDATLTARNDLSDRRYGEVLEELRLAKGRIANLETAGLAAWSVKKIMQLSGLIAAAGTVFGVVAAGIAWLILHIKW